MTETKNNAALVASILAVLTVLGAQVAPGIFENELGNYYVCPADMNLQEFNRLSGSQERGYPYEGTTKGYIDCEVDGAREKWIKLSVYAEQKGIDPYDLIIQEPEQTVVEAGKGTYICKPNNQGCVKV